MAYLRALILATVEGATEFLPVSSTGHLIIVEAIMSLTDDAAFDNAFLVIIQLPAIGAVVVYFWKDLWPPRTAGQKRTEIYAMWLKILAAFAPAILLGALLEESLERYLFFPVPVAIALILGGVIILVVERAHLKVTIPTVADLTFRTAILIGLFQCVAMIPGTSRSGATIVGAMILGLSRAAAAEFSFFLAIPTMTGAFAYDLYQNRHVITFDGAAAIAIGFIAAFVAALVVVRTLLGFVSRHGFTPFAVWRLIVGFAGLLGLWLLG